MKTEAEIAYELQATFEENEDVEGDDFLHGWTQALQWVLAHEIEYVTSGTD